MGWAETAVAALVCVLILVLAGAPVAIALRLRGLWLAASSSLFGMSAITTAAFVAPLVLVPWSVLPVLVVSLTVSAAVAGLLHFFPRTRPLVHVTSRWHGLEPFTTAIGLAAILIGLRLVAAIGSPDLFAQEHDNVFHLNAVRYVLDTLDASPNGVVQLSAPGSSSNYPSTWHALNALVIQITGVTVPVASNAVLLTVACLIWPAGALLLTRELFGYSRPLMLAAGVVSAGLPVFPLLLVADIGAYPLVMSIALLPAVLAAALSLAKLSHGEPLGRWRSVIILVGAAPALLGTHPSSIATLVALSVPLVVVVGIRAFKSQASSGARLIVLLAMVTYATGVLLFLLVFRPTFQGNSGLETLAGAVGSALVFSLADLPPALAVAALSLVGAVSAIRSRRTGSIAAVALWLAGLSLYVISAGPDTFVRGVVTAAWYRDPMRLAALTAVTVVPIAAYGASTVWAWLGSRLRPHIPAGGGRVILGAAATVLLIVATQGAAMAAVSTMTRASFDPTEKAPGVRVPLSADARELIARIPSLVPEGDLIAGNPRDGSSFAYALTGRRVLLPHLLSPRTADVEAFNQGFRTATPSDPACGAARTLGIRWVLQTRAPVAAVDPVWGGLSGLERSPNVEVADRVGSAVLFRVVGCGL